jgi:hypothetical protein
MIISHSKGVTFWKIPRTGSSTIELLIRLLAGLDLTQDVVGETHFYPSSVNFDTMPDHADGTPGTRRAHITPQTAIDNGFITLAQFNRYRNYCMVRDPVEKFISMYHVVMMKELFDPAQIITDHIIPSPNSAVFRKQTDWLTLSNMYALPFSGYVNSVNTILTAFGAPIPDQLPRVTRNHMKYELFVRSIATVGDRTAIETYYASDMALNT